MHHELLHRPPQSGLPEEHHSVQTLLSDCPHKPLGIRVGMMCELHPMRTITKNISV